MQPLEPAAKHAADVYWLAFLLTGQSEISTSVAEETLDDSFFSSWLRRWSRKVVISKALAAIRDEIAESVRRTEGSRGGKQTSSLRSRPLGRDTTKAELERALLAIDVFPRCALVLSVFEGLSLDDTAILLDTSHELIQQARASALQELTGNLARLQEQMRASLDPSTWMPVVQHA